MNTVGSYCEIEINEYTMRLLIQTPLSTMQRSSNNGFAFPIIVLLFLLQSCTYFRTHIDESCASQYRNLYPDNQDSQFVLPWEIGHGYTLTQGNCTFESHSLDAKQHMAFDFKMPMGTPIVASDSGRVFFVEERYRDHIDDNFHEANIIGIEHSGGALTWYMHLQFSGSLVEVDDHVMQGQIIGYSGNTGTSAYPHLHFFAQQLHESCHDSATKTANLDLCPHLPVSFSNVSPTDSVLKEFVKYTALPQ